MIRNCSLKWFMIDKFSTTSDSVHFKPNFSYKIISLTTNISVFSDPSDLGCPPCGNDDFNDIQQWNCTFEIQIIFILLNILIETVVKSYNFSSFIWYFFYVSY